MTFVPCRRHVYCKHPSTWFDRVICAFCDWMHTRCDNCGDPLDGICAEEPQRCLRCSKPKRRALRKAA